MQTALRKKTETGNEKDPSAALGSPFLWKGLAWILPPSIGRRCPEGTEVGWGKRYEREGKTIVSSTLFTKAPERRYFRHKAFP